MTAYPDMFNPDLIERIPLDAAAVLDVGCGGASLFAAFRRINPRARLFGIDSDPEIAAVAAARCDAFSAQNVEGEPLPFGPDQTFDCIIYGDVLEHLREPWRLVSTQIDRLNPGGTVLLCAPNVEHWSFVYRLLAGTWDYEPRGLLDETHMRWFTLETMRQNITRLGLSPYDVVPRIFDADRARAFVDLMNPMLRAIGVDPEAYARRAAPLQYVWRARRETPQRLTVAATMLKPVGGVSDLRVLQPLAGMSTDCSVLTQVAGRIEFRSPGLDEAKVVVLHRPILTGIEGVEHVRRLVRDGWLIVTEFDDHPDFFPAMRGDDQYAFTGVHAVQTTTEPLAGILRSRNPEVRIFPNAIRALPDVRNFGDPEKMTLFFGALNREQDWAPLVPVLNAVADMAGDRLRFCIVHDQTLFDALATAHKTFTPTCDHATYMQLLGDCEISLMPLADTAFNRVKSDLKFIEAAACRTAAVASRVVYGATIEDGRNGVLFTDPGELHHALLRLISIPDSARVLGDAARSYVAAERMLAYQIADRIAWYRTLWSRRRELNAALAERVPEIFQDWPSAADPGAAAGPFSQSPLDGDPAGLALAPGG